MITIVKEKDQTLAENLKGIKNHKKAAKHHEEAAKHHRAAAKYYEAGNCDKACISANKAHGEHNLAGEFQRKDVKNRSMYS